MPDGAPNVLTVSQLSNQLRFVVEKQFGRLAVEGEVGDCKPHTSGHIYLSLKDTENVLQAVVWRSTAQTMKVKPAAGMHVVAYGRLTTYGPRSSYQLVIDRIEPAGLGALMQMLEERRLKLAAEGLFDPARKKPLPLLPEVVGVITSLTGDVLRDVLHRLADRCPRRVLVWPVAVQGPGAKEQIAAAMAGMNALPKKFPRPDVLLLVRGGGSVEDLWVFNEELVVRAVAASQIPVITGVGHEPDYTLVDFAADQRAPTPTAAAELAVPVRSDLLATLVTHDHRQRQAVQRLRDRLRDRLRLLAKSLPNVDSTLIQKRLRLDDRADRLRASFRALFQLRRQRALALMTRGTPHLLVRYQQRLSDRLAQVQARLGMALRAHLKGARRDLIPLATRMQRPVIDRAVAAKRERLDRLERLLHSVSPHGPLARGYAYVTRPDGAVVASAKASAGPIVLHFADGTRAADLKETT
jgi:exodeoxyribonuclease VII large subunit